MNIIPGVVLFFGAIGTVALLGWDTFQNRKPITKAEMQQSRGTEHLSHNKREEGYLTEHNYG
mgnify:CR=1 FL=1